MRADDTRLTSHERASLTALRKWAHRDSTVAAACDHILATGECPDDDTLLAALQLRARTLPA